MHHPIPICQTLRALSLLAAMLSVGAVSCPAQPSAVEVSGMFSGPLPDATVVFQTPDGRQLTAVYDDKGQVYRFGESRDRRSMGVGGTLGTIRVTHPGYEPQTMAVKGDTAALHIRLGLPGSEYTYLGGRRIPYIPRYDEVGIVAAGLDSARLQKMVDTLGELSVNPSSEGSYFILRSNRPFLRGSDPRIAKLRAMLGPESVGPVARIGRGALLTPTILVRFMPSVRFDQARDILEREGCTNIRRELGQSFVATADPALAHGINDLMARLADRPEIESVANNALTLGYSFDSR